MNAVFDVAALIAIIATLKAISELNAVRAILYLIVSFLSVSVVFYVLGAPFAAALEVISYAGAIMVLFIFITLFVNLGPVSAKQEREWLGGRNWVGPSFLAAILLAEIIFGLFWHPAHVSGQVSAVVGPERVGAALLGRYVIGVELASMLLLGGLIGAFHLGHRERAAL